MLFKTLLYVILIVSTSVAYPDGAPTEACSDMTPQHTPYTSQESSPFSVTATKDSSNPDLVTVTVISTNQSVTSFRGIFLQARITEDGGPVGIWKNPDENIYQFTNCPGNADNALTHLNNMDKSFPVKFNWLAPDSSESNTFTFYVSIVLKYDTFFVKIPSNQITI